MARRRKRLHSVFVGHLARDVSEGELVDLFKGYETIRETHVRPTAQDDNFTFGFVRFESEEEAKHAIETLDGWPVHGFTIRVERAKGEAESAPAAAVPHRTVGGQPAYQKPMTHDKRKLDALKDALTVWDNTCNNGDKDPMEILRQVENLTVGCVPPYQEKLQYKPIELDELFQQDSAAT